jgi:gliding motility-associated-like protein
VINYYSSILSFFLSLTVIGQTVFYQDNWRGGISAAGANVGSGTVSSVYYFDLFVEPNSVIEKAFLISSSYGSATELSVSINSNLVFIKPSDIVTTGFVNFNSSTSYSSIVVTDITDIIIPDETVFELFVPSQENIEFGGYASFYVVVLYKNESLATISCAIVLNDKNATHVINYSLNELDQISSQSDVGFSMVGWAFCDTTYDGSIVFIEDNNIGLVGGDDFNAQFHCSGTQGHFYYQNQTFFGLGDDVANSYVSGPDAIANIKDYIVDGTTSVNIRFQHQTSLGTFPYSNPISNVILAYTSPCQPFEASLLTSDTTTCVNMPVQLGVSVHDTINATYEWLPQTNLSCYDCPNPIFTGDSTINYTVRIWSSDSCSKVLPVRVRVLPQPEFSSINLTPSACGEENGTIAGTSPSLNLPLNYSLNDGAAQNNGNFSGLASSTYTLTVTDSNGCSADSTVFIGEEILVNASFTVEPPTGSAPLWVQSTNASTNATNYLWSWADETSTDTHPGFYLDTSGTYTVTLIAHNNFPECADTFSVQVVVYDSLQISIPNIFTPNNDQSNDFFGITTNVPTSGTVVIFNRWGNLIVEKDFTTQPHVFEPFWDGMLFGGEKATEGVYFYSIKLEAAGEELEYSGFVTLVR